MRRSEAKVIRLELGERELPHDLDAEQAVISAALSNAEQRGDAINAGLRSTHFHHPPHGTVWEAIVDLDATGAVDLTTVGSRLSQANMLHGITDPHDDLVRGARYLARLATLSSATTLAGQYAADLIALSTRRRVTIACQTVAGEGYAGSRRGDEFVGWATEQVQRATEEVETVDTMASLGQIGNDRMSDIARWWSGELDPHGLPLPPCLATVDNDLHGLALGEVSFVAAGTGVGKSVLGTQVAAHISETVYAGHRSGALYLTLEMPKAMVFDRVLCHLAHVAYDVYRSGKHYNGTEITGDEAGRINDAGMRMNGMAFLIDDADQDLGRVRLSIRRAQTRLAKGGAKLRLVVIDHVHIMRMPDAERLDIAIADTVREFKRIAVELDLHVMVLAQFSREVSKKDQRPAITDIKNSSAIEQIADKILLIHRPYVAHKDKSSEEAKAIREDAEIIVGKHRNGALGVYPVKFKGERFAFEEEAAS